MSTTCACEEYTSKAKGKNSRLNEDSVVSRKSRHHCIFFSFSMHKLNLCFCALLKFGGPRGLPLTWWRCCGLCQRHKPTEPAHSFYSALVSISVLLVLSTVFHSINYPDNSLLSHSVLPVLILPYWSFQLYVSLRKSPLM